MLVHIPFTGPIILIVATDDHHPIRMTPGAHADTATVFPVLDQVEGGVGSPRCRFMLARGVSIRVTRRSGPRGDGASNATW